MEINKIKRDSHIEKYIQRTKKGGMKRDGQKTQQKAETSYSASLHYSNSSWTLSILIPFISF